MANILPMMVARNLLIYKHLDKANILGPYDGGPQE
jgi:hypothetical protein